MYGAFCRAQAVYMYRQSRHVGASPTLYTMTDSLLSYALRNRGRGTPADLSKSRKGSTTSQGGFAYAETRKPSAEDESEVIPYLGNVRIYISRADGVADA